MSAALKRKLEYHYKYFNISQISPDPLEFLHRYENYYDIEIAGIISSVFAYGNIKQIIATLEKIHTIMKNEPYEFLKKYQYKKGAKLFKDVYHRFYTTEDIASFFAGLKKVYETYGSLRNLFLLYYFDNEPHLKNAIHFFSQNLLELSNKSEKPSRGLIFMFPDPYKGSACKRMNLFLRWMVRKDDLDFGLWPEVSKDKLVIPVDTHVAKICRKLRLTKAKNISWKMAAEITERLKKYNPDDPVKYDFAICHIGMRKMKF